MEGTFPPAIHWREPKSTHHGVEKALPSRHPEVELELTPEEKRPAVCAAGRELFEALVGSVRFGHGRWWLHRQRLLMIDRLPVLAALGPHR